MNEISTRYKYVHSLHQMGERLAFVIKFIADRIPISL